MTDERLAIVLHACQDDVPILKSDQLVLVGSGYQTESDANAAGSRLQDALMVALAKVRVGADFGNRVLNGMFTQQGLQWVEGQIGQKTLNNIHGLMVFQSEPKPCFVSATGQATRVVSAEMLMSAFTQAIARQPQICDRDLLAYTLFHASFFQPTADSRFLLLVMSIEALIEPAPRSADAQRHVESLIKSTKCSSLPLEERNSIIGSLSRLRHESINQAGKRLSTERLGSRVYEGKTAADFFTYCYKIRSNIAHGNLAMPTIEKIGGVAAALEVFVSDLLTGPILGCAVQ